MKREIKFRCWDNVENKWRNFSLWDMFNYVYKFDNRYILQQYTGVKDKNGEEIYEGDIVSHLEDDSYLEPLIIEFNHKLPSKGKGTHLGFTIPNGKLKVIGNIYENPNLLTNH